VKSVTAKAKKLYMLYELQPSKELTGGVWYSDLEFDHSFIAELRNFILHCVRRLNNGKGCTIYEIQNKMVQGKVSKVQLQLKDIEQLIHTLVYDYMIEEIATTDDAGNTVVLYVHARRVSTPCAEFKWWNSGVLDSDFHFRTLRFDDGVVLAPHEPHYHTE